MSRIRLNQISVALFIVVKSDLYNVFKNENISNVVRLIVDGLLICMALAKHPKLSITLSCKFLTFLM